jgi:hypothetical protein
MPSQAPLFVPAEDGEYFLSVEKIISLKKKSDGSFDAISDDGKKYALSDQVGRALIAGAALPKI